MNDTPHSAKARAAEGEAKRAARALPAKLRPKRPKIDQRQRLIARLRDGDLLLMNGNLAWTWDRGGKPSKAAVLHMIRDGLLVGGGEYLFDPAPGKHGRSQTWRLADGV